MRVEYPWVNEQAREYYGYLEEIVQAQARACRGQMSSVHPTRVSAVQRAYLEAVEPIVREMARVVSLFTNPIIFLEGTEAERIGPEVGRPTLEKSEIWPEVGNDD